jgi:hypothetical protein
LQETSHSVFKGLNPFPLLLCNFMFTLTSSSFPLHLKSQQSSSDRFVAQSWSLSDAILLNPSATYHVHHVQLSEAEPVKNAPARASV